MANSGEDFLKGNPKIDALLTVLDDAQRRLGLTHGEQVLVLTMALAGSLAISDQQAARVCLLFLRAYVEEPGGAVATALLARLFTACSGE